jgi:predicted aspartyl protease
MKNTRYSGLAIRVALFYFTLAGTCQSIHAQSEIRFRLVHNTLIVVSLMAGEEGPFDFVLDTGADTTLVDPSIVPRLSLVSPDRVQQTTLAGVQTLTCGSIRTLSAGPAQAGNLAVLVQDLSELRKLDPHIEGIAGQNFLSHFNYLLDYRKHLVRIELASEIRDAISGDRLPMVASENRMIVASEAQSRVRAKLRLLLDSGANSMVLLRTASQALNLPTQESGRETTSSGQVGLQVGRLHLLTVGSEQFHDIAVALPDAEPAARIGDGLLPTALFQGLYVNNREGFVVLNPRAKKNASSAKSKG